MEFSYWKPTGILAVLFLLLQQACHMTTGEQIELEYLSTDEDEYQEGQTARIMATLRLPDNKPMSNYKCKWTVGIDTDFISETNFVYRDGSSDMDKGRYGITMWSNSSGTAFIQIIITDLKLEDERHLKLTVFNHDLTEQIVSGVVTFKVNPKIPLSSTDSPLEHGAVSTTPKLAKVSAYPGTTSSPDDESPKSGSTKVPKESVSGWNKYTIQSLLHQITHSEKKQSTMMNILLVVGLITITSQFVIITCMCMYWKPLHHWKYQSVKSDDADAQASWKPENSGRDTPYTIEMCMNNEEITVRPNFLRVNSSP